MKNEILINQGFYSIAIFFFFLPRRFVLKSLTIVPLHQTCGQSYANHLQPGHQFVNFPVLDDGYQDVRHAKLKVFMFIRCQSKIMCTTCSSTAPFLLITQNVMFLFEMFSIPRAFLGRRAWILWYEGVITSTNGTQFPQTDCRKSV